MRQRHLPLEVLTNHNGNPLKLKDRGRERKVVRILDFWRYGGRWWVGEPPRNYFLLELSDGNIVEVYQAAKHWTLSRVAD